MINRVVIVGRLTKDVEIRKTTTGLSVSSFTLAVDKRKEEGQDKSADFINCVAWRQQADFIGMYGRKGEMWGVDGRISTRSYTGMDGKKVYVTEVVADRVESYSPRDKQPMTEPKQNTPASATNNNYQEANNTQDDFGFNNGLEITTDDLPF